MDYTNHATCVDVTDSANVPQEGMSGIIKVLKMKPLADKVSDRIKKPLDKRTHDANDA